MKNILILPTLDLVINLSIDKQKVFNEIYRVLKENGFLIVSDEVYTACLAGAILKQEYIKNY